MVKKSMEFVSLDKALNVDWSSDSYAKRVRRMDPSFFILQILLEFQSREGCSPRAEMRYRYFSPLSRSKITLAAFFKRNVPNQCLFKVHIF